MTSVFSIHHNALLLACFKSWFRPNLVLRQLVLLPVLLAVAVLVSMIYGRLLFPDPIACMLFNTYLIQGFLLFVGTMRVAATTAQERLSGTLDLHRLSPQSRTGLVIGLLIGGASPAWALALVLVPAIITAGVVLGLPFMDMVFYESAFFLGALVAGQLLMMTMMTGREKALKAQTSNIGSLFGIVFVVFVAYMSYFESIKFALTSCSATIHAFVPYTIVYFWSSLQEVSGGQVDSRIPLAAAFGLQAATHVPLLCFGIWVAVRQLRYRERVLFSKAQAYTAAAIVYGFYVAELFNNGRALSMMPMLVLLLAPLALYSGILLVFTTSPHYRTVMWGYYLDPENRQERWPHVLFSEHTSLRHWLVGYALLTLLAMVPAWLLLHGAYEGHPVRGFAWFLPLFCVFALAQAGCFAGFYEIYLMGGFGRKTYWFPLVIALLWLAAPLLEIVANKGENVFLYYTGMIVSPLVACPRILFDFATGDKSLHYPEIYRPLLVWGIALNTLAAGVFFSIAAKLRRRLWAGVL